MRLAAYARGVGGARLIDVEVGGPIHEAHRVEAEVVELRTGHTKRNGTVRSGNIPPGFHCAGQHPGGRSYARTDAAALRLGFWGPLSRKAENWSATWDLSMLLERQRSERGTVVREPLFTLTDDLSIP